MNYHLRNPTISFRLDSNFQAKLTIKGKEKNLSQHEIARWIIKSYLNGNLVEKKPDINIELQQARLEKIKLENKLLKMKVDFGENFQKPMSLSGTRLISANVKQIQEDIQSPYDELNKRLKCPDCTRPFEWLNQSGFIDQIKEFSNHLKISHNRELNALEKDVIDNLQYEEIK